MKVYVLTEESDNSVKIYLFSTLEKAKEKMKSLYEHIIDKVGKTELEECTLDLDHQFATAYISTLDDSWYWEIHSQEVE